MIRRLYRDGELLITQNEHALQAGRFAALHRELPEPRAALVRAVALHDAGWPLLDDRPRPLPDGRAPHVFDFEAGTTVAAWRRSVAVARASGPLEALIVSRHFGRFSDAFAREQADLQAAWRIGVDPAVEEAGVELLGLCDSLSLRVLCGPDDEIAVDPWPFRVDRVDDTVTGRLLPARRWESEKALRSAYSEAPSVVLAVSLRPDWSH